MFAMGESSPRLSLFVNSVSGGSRRLLSPLSSVGSVLVTGELTRPVLSRDNTRIMFFLDALVVGQYDLFVALLDGSSNAIKITGVGHATTPRFLLSSGTYVLFGGDFGGTSGTPHAFVAADRYLEAPLTSSDSTTSPISQVLDSSTSPGLIAGLSVAAVCLVLLALFVLMLFLMRKRHLKLVAAGRSIHTPSYLLLGLMLILCFGEILFLAYGVLVLSSGLEMRCTN